MIIKLVKMISSEFLEPLFGEHAFWVSVIASIFLYVIIIIGGAAIIDICFNEGKNFMGVKENVHRRRAVGALGIFVLGIGFLGLGLTFTDTVKETDELPDLTKKSQ